MKTYLDFIVTLLTFLLSLTINLKKATDVLKKPENFNDILLSDYRNLSGFSEQMKAYGICKESFKELFWKGAEKSLDFYLSTEFLKESLVNSLVEKQLWMNSGLEHPINKPNTDKTNASRASKVLNTFSGKWHGKWKAMKVHHLWLPVRKSSKELNHGFTLIGFQSCFTGDGFGWNYIVKKKNSIIVLGFVYHFDSNGQISSKNPHYAFLNSNNQLTWVSDSHIYYEFICNDSNCSNRKHYIITGAQYLQQPMGLKLISGFQAVYLSEDYKLPTFKNLNIAKLNYIRGL
ncbi:hypothetical protein MTsPCn9_25280 [Croceitalea sp. MTPC9]|uniref:hypothetical protein n=1 Tax=unclassified Croceitalea TaxID=2632280 RepID=UPI002B3F9FFD|nr:hypothetical protein MTsPCn6_29250 [Croceitalea sp. MTPC6]GMN17590.1 hypothetical protein MTsPCn9_25280 [Croceitalea sp. MTPC9]